MTAETATRPARGLAWFRTESTPASLAIAGVGAAGVVLVVAGSIVALVAHGLVPLDSLVEGLRSGSLRGVLIGGIVAGAVALIAGATSFRRMPTRLAREETVAGAVLGIQAAILGSVALWFVQGDIETFAQNFLDFEVLGPHVGAFVNGAKNTLFLALSGEGIGIVLGLVIALLAISKRAVVRAPARIYVNFFRGTPLLWQLSVFYFGLSLGLDLDLSAYTAGIIVFGLNTAAYAAEVFRAGIQSIERGQLEAARGLGMSYMQAMRYAVVPQAVRRVIPPLFNEFIILVKDTSLVLFLGLTRGQRDLMSVGNAGYGNTFNATFFVGTAIGYLVVSLPLIRLVNVLERRLRSGLVGVTGR